MLISTLFSTIFTIGIIFLIYSSFITIKGFDDVYSQCHFSIDDIDQFSITKHNQTVIKNHLLFLIQISSLFVITGYVFMDSLYIIGITTYVLLLSVFLNTIINIQSKSSSYYCILASLFINLLYTPFASVLALYTSCIIYAQYLSYESEQMIDRIELDEDDDRYNTD